MRSDLNALQDCRAKRGQSATISALMYSIDEFAPCFSGPRGLGSGSERSAST